MRILFCLEIMNFLCIIQGDKKMLIFHELMIYKENAYLISKLSDN